MPKYTAAALAAALMLFSIFPCQSKAVSTSASAAILVDADSGRVLYEQNADGKMLIASTTKIMTALVAIENGDLDDVWTVKRAETLVEGTSMYLREGEQLTLETMLYGLLLCSGNDAAEALRGSKKWGWSGNTETFERVSNAIDASIGQLSAPLSGDLTQDQETLDDIIASFDDLITACDDYLGRSSRTDRGKHRQAIVRQVRELAVKDRGGFVRYRMTPDEGEHFTSAMDVLTKSRQRTLQLVDKKEAELEHVGGAASYIAKIDKGMLTDQDASGFFKEDEVHTKFAEGDGKGRVQRPCQKCPRHRKAMER